MIGSIFLFLIPLLAYWLTDIPWLLMFWIVTLPIIVFDKLKKHHENKRFIEPGKVWFYRRASSIARGILVFVLAVLELAAVVLDVYYGE